MTNQKEIYKCEICGNIVEVLHTGIGTLVCCGKNMTLMDEKAKEEGSEKHLPVIEGKIVKIGSIAHPMEEKHYIEWIEASDGEKSCKIFLKPGDEPKAEFNFEVKQVKTYCNIHGLWKKS